MTDYLLIGGTLTEQQQFVSNFKEMLSMSMANIDKLIMFSCCEPSQNNKEDILLTMRRYVQSVRLVLLS